MSEAGISRGSGFNVMKVIKFGGSSLTDAESYHRVKDLLIKEKEDKVLVLSAMQGITKELQNAIKKSVKRRR